MDSCNSTLNVLMIFTQGKIRGIYLWKQIGNRILKHQNHSLVFFFIYISRLHIELNLVTTVLFWSLSSYGLESIYMSCSLSDLSDKRPFNEYLPEFCNYQLTCPAKWNTLNESWHQMPHSGYTLVNAFWSMRSRYVLVM